MGLNTDILESSNYFWQNGSSPRKLQEDGEEKIEEDSLNLCIDIPKLLQSHL